MQSELESSPPRALVILQGHTASGKSSLARALRDRDPAHVSAVHSAVVRKDLGLCAQGQYRFDLRDARFTREVSGRVYAELLARAAQQLTTHEVVVLDAAYNFYAQRVPVYTLAGNRGLCVVGIRCDCPDPERVRARLEARKQDPADPFNEATDYETYRSTIELAEDIRGDRERLPRPSALLEFDSLTDRAQMLYAHHDLPRPLASWLAAHPVAH
jgi:predicted kinase